MCAAHRGRLECAKALLRSGADPNYMNNNGDLVRTTGGLLTERSWSLAVACAELQLRSQPAVLSGLLLCVCRAPVTTVAFANRCSSGPSMAVWR